MSDPSFSDIVFKSKRPGSEQALKIIPWFFEILPVENMTQLIWPSLYEPDLQYAIDECKIVAQKIYGDEMEHDFDMMICKNTNVETPWHQVKPPSKQSTRWYHT